MPIQMGLTDLMPLLRAARRLHLPLGALGDVTVGRSAGSVYLHHRSCRHAAATCRLGETVTSPVDKAACVCINEDVGSMDADAVREAVTLLSLWSDTDDPLNRMVGGTPGWLSLDDVDRAEQQLSRNTDRTAPRLRHGVNAPLHAAASHLLGRARCRYDAGVATLRQQPVWWRAARFTAMCEERCCRDHRGRGVDDPRPEDGRDLAQHTPEPWRATSLHLLHDHPLGLALAGAPETSSQWRAHLLWQIGDVQGRAVLLVPLRRDDTRRCAWVDVVGAHPVVPLEMLTVTLPDAVRRSPARRLDATVGDARDRALLSSVAALADGCAPEAAVARAQQLTDLATTRARLPGTG